MRSSRGFGLGCLAAIEFGFEEGDRVGEAGDFGGAAGEDFGIFKNSLNLTQSGTTLFKNSFKVSKSISWFFADS